MTNLKTIFYNKNVLLLGLGVSHALLAGKLVQVGANVTIADKNDKQALEKRIADGALTANSVTDTRVEGTYKQNISDIDTMFPMVNFVLGENYLSAIENADIIFRTPGMYWFHPALAQAKAAGKVVTSEMEVFFDLCPCKIYAITGSDGKTTTSTLIAKILERSGKKVHLGGNIGKALLPEVDKIAETDAAVVELSSFQLLSMRPAPDVAVITNITPNHLDVHHDMDEYISAKKNLISHQGAFSRTVLNHANEETRKLADLVRGNLLWFNSSDQSGVYKKDDKIYCENTAVLDINDILLPGEHNVENYMAAIAAVYDGTENMKNAVCETAKTFGGVPHRIELVKIVGGVRYYNDSISTSPARTVAGVKTYKELVSKSGGKLILILGGYDKNLDFAPLAPVLKDCANTCITLGATADKIEKSLKDVGYKGEIIRVADLETAVKTANEKARKSDVVALSPASASFDMYRNFEARGDHFKRLIEDL
jgi:UDP-N-acetylmuramoylalanine--D-glutamate ligase